MVDISIIVPIYNVEKYLKTCIDSILAQRFKDFELILVDDGSTDDCGNICDKYSLKDNRIKTIHKENGGLSSARNSGIDIAKGKYIGFIDGDDHIHPDMYNILFENIVKYDSDMVMCNFQYVNENDKVKLNSEDGIFKINHYDKIEALNMIYSEESIKFIVAWNKLYKRELFSDIRYEVGKVCEDEFAIHKLLYKCNVITYIDLPMYFYVQSSNSIMRKKFNVKRLDSIEALKDRMNFFNNNNEEILYRKTQDLYAGVCISQYIKAKKELIEIDNKLKIIKKDFHKNLLSLLNNPYVNWKTKILWIIFFINPSIYDIIKRHMCSTYRKT